MASASDQNASSSSVGETMDTEDAGSPGSDVIENPEVIIQESLKRFNSADFIMEPAVFGQLKNYFEAGGAPEQVIKLLSKNYLAVAQMANLMAEWLILTGHTIEQVQNMVEEHMKELVTKVFDPKKADTIFSEEGEPAAWLTEMVEHFPWRSLVYKLAEDYPDCLMLNFTIKLISDAGFQGEITSVSTASQQIEVFSRILKTFISNVLRSSKEDQAKNLRDYAKMVCHGQHTFVYTVTLLHLLEGEKVNLPVVTRLCQEVCAFAAQQGHDVAPILMALKKSGTDDGDSAIYIRSSQVVGSMLSKKALNPADITLLHKFYFGPDPPAIHLIRIPQFLDLLVDSLFKPGMKINPEHKSKYVYLLAYAASVIESKEDGRRVQNKDELKPTAQAIERAHAVCADNKTSAELLAELSTLYHYLRFPVVAVGITRWVSSVVLEPSYFKLNIEHTPIHLVLLDEVVAVHPILHQDVLKLLQDLFEVELEDLEILVQLELKKMVIDRMVNLVSKGCVIPVLKYMSNICQKEKADFSLVRYFVKEILEMVAPPFSNEFIENFSPLIENEKITGSIRSATSDTDGHGTSRSPGVSGADATGGRDDLSDFLNPSRSGSSRRPS